MLIIGLTGGIGSGKTTVTNKFSQLGVDIIDADVIARDAVNHNARVKAAIFSAFGSAVRTQDNQINRAALRSMIFEDKTKKQKLEDITHPIIRLQIQQALSTASHAPYKIYSSPLLFETQQHTLCDKVVVVDVPETTQVTRTSSRDNQTTTQVKQVIDAQCSRIDKLHNADFIIDNNQTLAHTYLQIESLHQTFTRLALQKHQHESTSD